ncbi:hypothetical protein JCM10212_002202, partial [Sporobolomyces blumeae]
YVVELRSLVENYANPLLHPLLSSPKPKSSPAFTSSPSPRPNPSDRRDLRQRPESNQTTTTRQSSTLVSSPSASSTELPIAAKFLRSTPSSLSGRTSTCSTRRDHDQLGIPDMADARSPRPSSSSSSSTSTLTRDDRTTRGVTAPGIGPKDSASRLTPSDARIGTDAERSTSSKDATGGRGGGVTSRLASLAFGRSRKTSGSRPKPPSPSSSNHDREPTLSPLPNSSLTRLDSRSKPHTPIDGSPAPPPPLPDCLRDVLEATVAMFKGHEELSTRLKDQWAKAFPLVRGLAAIWSDQPWFLETYARYIVSLEECLSLLDVHLPASHPHAPGSSFSTSHTTSSNQTRSALLKLNPLSHTRHAPPSTTTTTMTTGRGDATTRDPRLTVALQQLEQRAAETGESNLSICLSKPLMRLSKLPLLMQALLFHTDPTTHEWEKTRAMALEVDALVRSIEDEKIEEDQRERTRDVLARIDGINVRALMTPRNPRILISESLAPIAPSTLPSSSNGKSRGNRRTSAAGGGGGTTGGGTLMSFGRNKSKGAGIGQDWLIRFTDVVVRAVKVGETSIPGSFSREKEKQGKQGKTRKEGSARNTYRFVRVERWESPEQAELAWRNLNERSDRVSDVDESDDEGGTVGYAASRMSFRYDSDEPQPAVPRDFTTKRSSSAPTPDATKASLVKGQRHASASTTPAANAAKFAGRLRVGSEDVTAMRSVTPSNRHRFNSPTLSSALKSHSSVPPPHHHPSAATLHPETEKRIPLVEKPNNRTTSTLPSNGSLTTLSPPTSGIGHARDESTYNLYKMWSSTQE